MDNNDFLSKDGLDRRDFIKLGAAAGLGVTVAGPVLSCQMSKRQLATVPGQPQIAPIDPVRIGFVGVGMQGSSHVRNFLNIEGVEVRAICDIIPNNLKCDLNTILRISALIFSSEEVICR